MQAYGNNNHNALGGGGGAGGNNNGSPGFETYKKIKLLG